MGGKHTTFKTEVMSRVNVDTSVSVSAMTQSSSGVSVTTSQIQSIEIGPNAVVYAGDISMLQASGQSVTIYSSDETTISTDTVQSLQTAVAQSASSAITQTAQDIGAALQSLGGNTDTNVTNTINEACTDAAQTVVTATTVSSLLAQTFNTQTQTLVINGQINVNSLTLDQHSQVNVAMQQMVYNTLASALDSSAMSTIVNNANNQLTQSTTGIAGIVDSIGNAIGNAFSKPLMAGAMVAGLMLIILIVLFKFVFGGGGSGKRAAPLVPGGAAGMPYGGAYGAPTSPPAWGDATAAAAGGEGMPMPDASSPAASVDMSQPSPQPVAGSGRAYSVPTYYDAWRNARRAHYSPPTM